MGNFPDKKRQLLRFLISQWDQSQILNDELEKIIFSLDYRREEHRYTNSATLYWDTSLEESLNKFKLGNYTRRGLIEGRITEIFDLKYSTFPTRNISAWASILIYLQLYFFKRAKKEIMENKLIGSLLLFLLWR